jgi:hypothetical protein
MRFIRLTAVGMLLAALTVPVVASSATAATADVIPTAIVDLSASPPTISVGNTQITLSGRLVESADPSIGVPNEQVDSWFFIADEATPEINLPATTGPDGSFTFSYTEPAGGLFGVGFSGDSTYGSAGASIDVIADPEATSITLNAQPEALVPAGTTLTFTGKAEAITADGTQPLADVDVNLFRNRLETGPNAFTNADGTFTITLTAYSGGTWLAAVDPGWPQAYVLYQQSKSNTVQVNVEYQTRAAVSVPAEREAHSTFTVSGDVQTFDGTNRWFSASGVLVNYYYRVLPAGNWVKAGSAETDASGSFGGTARVVPGHLTWQVRVPEQSPGDVYLPSVSATDNSFVTDHTCTGIAVRYVDGRTIVSGAVRDSCAAKQQSFGAVKGEVKVYYHPRGTTSWRYLGEVRIGGGGTFTYSRGGVLNGYFQADFPAQGYYLASKSNEVYKS